METDTIRTLVQGLRANLVPVEQATFLADAVEGLQPDARKAAVLLPLFEQDGQLFLAFIRRATTLRSHSGEIAFPGGGVDRTDDSMVMTALREAQEEIGLNPTGIEVLGVLSPVFTVVSNYLILPVVAFLPHGLGDVLLQESEVTELLIVPVRDLADPHIMHTEVWSRNGRTRTVYFYDYGNYRIWGATGRILNALLEVIAKT